MSLLKVKKTAQKLQEQVPEVIQALRDKHAERTERWQRSKRGKDMKLDIHLLENLLAAAIDFNDSIEHLTEEEE